MKKQTTLAIPFLLILWIMNYSAHAQIAYYDAFTLKKHLIGGKWNDTDQVVKTILRKYLKTDEDIQSEFASGNPFTKDYFSGISTLSSYDALPSSLADLSSLNVAGLADGLTQFIVKRTKQELSVAFFEKFHELISREEYKDARLLFPQTYATLNAIGDEIYNYKAYINVLRVSFEKDMNGLLPDLKNVIESGSYRDFFSTHPEYRAAGLSAIYIGDQLLNKQHPGAIIDHYDSSLLKDIHNNNVMGGVSTLQLFSTSLRSLSGKDYWIGKDSLKLLTNDPVALNIYFGLIYQNAEDINFEGGKTLQSLMTDARRQVAELNKVVLYMQGLINQADIIKTQLATLTNGDPKNLTFNDYFSYYNSALDLMQYAVNYSNLPGLGQPYVPAGDFQPYIDALRSGGNLALDINRKNYSSAVINVYNIYSFGLKKYMDEMTAVMNDTHATATQIDAARSAWTNADNIQKYLIKYGSFIATVSQAQNADDIETAIEAVALPSGSSSIKRETRFNVALNAYAGPYFGAEKIHDLDAQLTKSGGLSAPIGIAVSMGNRKFFWLGSDAHKNWSYSLFFSIVDLGALASYRFSESSASVNKTDTATTAQVPVIQLKNIISPGAFFSIGIPKTPLSLSAGWQIGPNLRSVSATGANAAKLEATYANKLYSRYSIALLIDLPLLNFYTKSK